MTRSLIIVLNERYSRCVKTKILSRQPIKIHPITYRKSEAKENQFLAARAVIAHAHEGTPKPFPVHILFHHSSLMVLRNNFLLHLMHLAWKLPQTRRTNLCIHTYEMLCYVIQYSIYKMIDTAVCKMSVYLKHINI